MLVLEVYFSGLYSRVLLVLGSFTTTTSYFVVEVLLRRSKYEVLLRTKYYEVEVTTSYEVLLSNS